MSSEFRVPILNWSFGTLPKENTDKLSCEWLSDVENPKKVIAVLATDGRGRSYLSKQDNSPYCNNFLVIRNKKTNAVRYFAVDQYVMSPYGSSMKPTSNSAVKNEEPTKLNASHNLTKAFGSKQDKRKIKMEQAIEKFDNIRKTTKRAVLAHQQVLVKKKRASGLVLPPRNRAVKSIDDVYDVREIMSPELMNDFGLDLLANEIMERDRESFDDPKFSTFLTDVLAQIQHRNVLKMKMLIFADSLMQFLRTPICKYRSEVEPIFCKYSFVLNEKIKEFCCLRDGTVSRPVSMRDKILCYVLVLLLLIND